MMARLLTRVLWWYQATISGFLGSRCRFHPSCSNYAIEAIHIHGPVHGTWLAAQRLAKCHPFHPGGVDLVPDAEKARPSSASLPAEETIQHSGNPT